MSMWQARRIIVAAFEHVHVQRRGNWPSAHVESISRGSIQFAKDSIEFDGVDAKGRKKHYRIDPKTFQSVSSKCHRYGSCDLKADSQDRDTRKLVGLLHLDANGDFQGDVLRNAAEALTAAVNRLHALAVDDRAVLFPQQVATWRALNQKPPLPEAVREQRVLAENALKEKQPEEALNYYEAGLELYPTWPQGCFNAALIAAELGFYSQAVEHMQWYVELVPNAPDAKAARDQTVIWQDKANNPGR